MRGTPSVTALKGTNSRSVELATRCASVVLPLPGGPQKIIEPGVPRSIASRNGFPIPSRCSCPTNSSSVAGRMRAASGRVSGPVLKSDFCLVEDAFFGIEILLAKPALNEPLRYEESHRPAQECQGADPTPLGLDGGDQIG